MKLSEYLKQGKVINRKAELTIDINLNNGEYRKCGDEVSIVLENSDGSFHAEDNDWACTVKRKEFSWI